MAYTQQGILEQLKDAQITGGSIIVSRDGKNIEVAKVRSRSGELFVTDAGKKILAEAPAAVEEVAEDKPVRGRRKAVVEETEE